MRIIMHVDFDYFYAQCEELRNPSIKDKPVVVCVYSARGNDSGAVSTANYKAREYGVKSGISIKSAKDRLKDVDAVFLSVDHDYYDMISEKAMNIIKRYADKFEHVGDDEAYLDISSIKDYDKARDLALKIKDEVRSKVGLSISIGIAPNKLLAKIASDYQKPNGLTIIKPEEVDEFIKDMDISKITGIGKKTRARLNELGIKTIKDLRELSIYTLTKEFGKKTGIYLYNASRGIDDEEVKEDESITQFSRIVTLKRDTNNIEDMLDDLKSLCNEVHKTAIENNYSFRSIGIMLVLNDMSMRSKSRTLRALTNNRDELYKVAKRLLMEVMKDKPIVRRLGVKVFDLVSSKGQDTLLKFM
ncbi:MAG: DNA polymerase IV [Candidatus Nitrosocaldaceae archaeon]|nr:MAG: DNA polymerase IV [Candidatus Nitrosocaldaceae archaeon]